MSIILMSIILMSIILMSVILLNVILLNVVAPLDDISCRQTFLTKLLLRNFSSVVKAKDEHENKKKKFLNHLSHWH